MSLSVTALRPPLPIFREEQRFGWWVYFLLALMMALAWVFFLARQQGAGHLGLGFNPQAVSLAVALAMFLPVFFVLALLRMTTLVTPIEIRVWFGFLPTYRRAIPIGSIARVEVVQFHPVTEHGGWGIRRTRDGERVYSARGNRGVRLHLVDGSKILIGSQRPEELVLALEGARMPGL